VNEALDESLPDRRPAADPEAVLDERLTREGLIQAVGQLTELQQQVIGLKFAGGLSNAQVARLLGRTEGAVKALQHAALRSLQRRLAKAATP
jgi:RNA polymerase sigma-70 factor (ECF subfamily)